MRAIVAKRSPLPDRIITPVGRWRVIGQPGTLVKRYDFREKDQRDKFLISAFCQESLSKHTLRYSIAGLAVEIVLSTEGIGVTEVDRDVARGLDVLFRDAVYSLDA